MDRMYFSKQGLVPTLCALAMVATGCIREDLEPCNSSHKLTLKVVNAEGDEITESGAVTQATLYVFDEDFNYLESRRIDGAAIKERKEIALDYGGSNELTLVAWGNMSEKREVVTQAQRIEELKVILKSNNGLAVQADNLYFGRLTVATQKGLPNADRQIVIAPQTGSVKISTQGLQYAINRLFGLKAAAPHACRYTLDRTLDQYTHQGELAGSSVYYNPDAQWVGTEWNTNQYNTYLGTNLTISLDVDGKSLVDNVGQDDFGEPLSVEKGQTKFISLRFSQDGVLVSVRTSVRPWDVVLQNPDID